MSFQIPCNQIWHFLQALLCAVACFSFAIPNACNAQGKFEVSGKAVSKTKYGFEVTTSQNGPVQIAINEATDFALRMSHPWFDTEAGKVVVNGKRIGGKRERIKFELPKGKLYLLVQFRTAKHRDRIMSSTPWRINHYLLSDEKIEPALPAGKDLLMAGEVNLETSELIINGRRHPIKLGFRGATLRGRSIADIKVNETTVMVFGKESNGRKLAETVLFTIR